MKNRAKKGCYELCPQWLQAVAQISLGLRSVEDAHAESSDLLRIVGTGVPDDVVPVEVVRRPPVEPGEGGYTSCAIVSTSGSCPAASAGV